MIIEITEKLIPFSQAQLTEWKSGINKRSLLPDYLNEQEVSLILNQPEYHFGEIHVLKHYHDEGWLGCSSYALGNNYPASEARKAGQEKVRRVISKEKRKRFVEISSKTRDVEYGTGEPDLFLYKPDGEYMFVEVKKQTDRIRPAQFTCIAQILATLDCKVDIVYLCEEGHSHTPKTYCFNLNTFQGQAKK